MHRAEWAGMRRLSPLALLATAVSAETPCR